MGRIPGYYEWDDNTLTPSQKREGGLHQNLFDKEGKLKGSARFIPADGDITEPLLITNTVYIPVEERRKSKEQEELDEAIQYLISALVDMGIEIAKPYVKHWWRESFQPFAGKQWSKLRRNKRTAHSPGPDPDNKMAQVPVPGTSTTLALQDSERPRMSSAEAQARMLAATAARAFADEQMRLVNNAEIVDQIDADGVRDAISKLPPETVAELVKRMATSPSMLEEKSLAELASVLAREDIGRGKQLNTRAFNEDSLQ